MVLSGSEEKAELAIFGERQASAGEASSKNLGPDPSNLILILNMPVWQVLVNKVYFQIEVPWIFTEANQTGYA